MNANLAVKPIAAEVEPHDLSAVTFVPRVIHGGGAITATGNILAVAETPGSCPDIITLPACPPLAKDPGFTHGGSQRVHPFVESGLNDI